MKFTITFKDPDGVSDSIQEEATNSLSGIEFFSNKEKENMTEARAEFLQDFISKWIEYGEYVTIEFDTDTGTAIVLKK